MKKFILVVTPNKGFGELIYQILEETGEFEIALATSGQNALDISRNNEPQLCILEPGIKDYALDKLIDSFNLQYPNMKLVLIAPEGIENNEELIEQIPVDEILFKPLYLQDIVVKVEDMMKGEMLGMLANTKPNLVIEPEIEEYDHEDDNLSWDEDINVASEMLNTLNFDSDAHMLLIMNNENIWASSGDYNDSAIEEIKALVIEYFANDTGNDLARFVQLESNNENLMLYATTLKIGFILAMGFDSNLPFSNIRKQAYQIAEKINATHDIAKSDDHSESDFGMDIEDTMPVEIDIKANEDTFVIEIEDTESNSDLGALMEEIPKNVSTNVDFIDSLLGNDETVASNIRDDDVEKFDQAEELLPSVDSELSFIEEFLENAPNQDLIEGAKKEESDVLDEQIYTEIGNANDVLLQETASEIVEKNIAFTSMLDDFPSLDAETEELPIGMEEEKNSFLDELLDENGEDKNQLSTGFVEIIENEDNKETGEELALDEEDISLPTEIIEDSLEGSWDHLAPTMPSKINVETTNFEIESVSASMYCLRYVYTLLPRLPHIKLTGEIKRYLLEWVSEICLAYDWRVESLSINPDYMQWMVNVTPNNSPAKIVKTIREYTSEKLITQFPSLNQINPSGEFWASGYLVIGDPNMVTNSLIHKFIADTRKRQGVGNIKSS